MEKESLALISMFRKKAREFFCRGDRVLVAVSGGPDSMALLFLLLEIRPQYRLELFVAHFDHGLRGSDSLEDARFVEGLAADLGLAVHTGRGDVMGLKEREGLSIEEACRELRYKFFKELANGLGINKVALGHNADDQAEEFLIRLIRGSGARGLSGIPARRENLFVRPLLSIPRKDILAYLTAKNVSFRTDISNYSQNFLRNRIRHNLLPILERDFNPRIRSTLIQTAAILGEDDTLLTRMAEEVWPDLIRCSGGEESEAIVLNLNKFGAIARPVQMRIISKSLGLIGAKVKNVGFRHLDSIQRLCCEGGPYKVLSLPGQITVERIYEELIFRKKQIQPEAFLYTIDGPGKYSLPEIGQSVALELKAYSGHAACHGKISYFDYERVRFPLIVRNFCPGDRFRPSGLSGSQKIKDYFINMKIPRPNRKKIPLLVQNGAVIGIIGWDVDEDVRVTEKTEKMLQVALE